MDQRFWVTFEQQWCERDQGRSQTGDQVPVGLVVPGWVLQNKWVRDEPRLIDPDQF